MPARTLSASPDRLPQFVPSSQAYFYRPRPSRSSPTRRDPRANPHDSERAPPAVSVPLHLLPMDTPERPLLSHSHYGTLDTVYPPDPLPYPSQAPAYSWSSYRNSHVLVPSYAAQMHHHSSIPPGPHHPPWHPHVRLQPILSPPPPPIAHKVWILDCKSCGIFFTNRGMKAVLLLRPNVPLYSTDALPINCSAYSPSLESNTRSSSSTAPPPFVPIPGSRTCECLTQTLCCHGCGSAIGYMIVNPCRRCTSSISASNRTTNGHRFVFYSAEVCASERHYVPGEQGVMPFHPASQTQAPHASRHSLFRVNPFEIQGERERETPSASPVSDDSSESMPALMSDSDLDFSFAPPRSRSPSGGSAYSMHALISPSSSSSRVPLTPPPTRLVSTNPTNAANSPERMLNGTTATSSSAAQAEGPASPERLKAGEVLHWHNLVRSGEIPPVCDDSRARGRSAAPRGEARCVTELKEEQQKDLLPSFKRGGVFAGR